MFPDGTYEGDHDLLILAVLVVLAIISLIVVGEITL